MALETVTLPISTDWQLISAANTDPFFLKVLADDVFIHVGETAPVAGVTRGQKVGSFGPIALGTAKVWSRAGAKGSQATVTRTVSADNPVVPAIGDVAVTVADIAFAVTADTVVSTVQNLPAGAVFTKLFPPNGLLRISDDGRSLVRSAIVTRPGRTDFAVWVNLPGSLVGEKRLKFSATLLPVPVIPLPALPLATGARIAVLGDSQGARNTSVTAEDRLGVSTIAWGPVNWAHAADPRWNADNWYDATDPWKRNYRGSTASINGDRLVAEDPSAQGIVGGGIVKRLETVLRSNADIVLFSSPAFNTIHNGDVGIPSTEAGRTAYVVDKLDEMLRATRAAGKWAILCTTYPTDIWTAGDYRYAVVANVNSWIRAQAGREGVARIIDTDPTLAPAGVLDASCFWIDSGARIHLNTKGAQLVALKHYLPAIQACVQAGTTFDVDPTVSSLLPASDGQMLGTGGGKPGVSGVVATDFVARKSSSVHAVAGSKVGTTGITKQVLTVTPNGTAAANLQPVRFEFPRLSLRLPADIAAIDGTWTNVVAPNGGAMPVAGDFLRAGIFFEVAGDAPEINTLNVLRFSLWDTSSGAKVLVASNAAFWQSTGDAADPKSMPNATTAELGQTRKGWLRTPPLLVPAGTTVDVIEAVVTSHARCTGAVASYTLALERPIIRKVADPRPAWNFPTS